MKHISRFFGLILAVMLMTVSGAVASQTYTVTEEEYNLLQKYKRLEEIKMIIDAEFLFEYDENRLLEGMAQGMLGVLGDDYTYYINPEEAVVENEKVTGVYCGVGIEVSPNANDMTITIRRVFHGGPAQKVGIRPGDKIITVNGAEYGAYELNDAVSVMRGEKGGEVTLGILRDREYLEFVCIRDFIETEIISSEILGDHIGYVKIYEFEGNATGQFSSIIQDFLDKEVQGVIMDLRSNLGGMVHLATDIASVFIEDGVIMAEEDKFGRILPRYASRGRAWDIPLVLLVDEYTCSAAEILAAALQENGVATLVGTKTFGKGIMQAVHPFYDDGALMHITSGYWLTPNGNKIHKEGIEPDVTVKLDEDAVDDNFEIIREKDNQLQKAIEVLKGKM